MNISFGWVTYALLAVGFTGWAWMHFVVNAPKNKRDGSDDE